MEQAEICIKFCFRNSCHVQLHALKFLIRQKRQRFMNLTASLKLLWPVTSVYGGVLDVCPQQECNQSEILKKIQIKYSDKIFYLQLCGCRAKPSVSLADVLQLLIGNESILCRSCSGRIIICILFLLLLIGQSLSPWEVFILFIYAEAV